MCYYNQFRDQACSLMRINHPNWISIIDYFEENGTSYYVSEYVEGETLFNYYYHNELLSEQQVLHAFKCITRVLHKMFRLNIFHANISPQNILIGKDGQVYLKGFGFPILFDDDEDRFIFTDEECNERHLLPGEEFGWNYRYSPEGRRYNLTESYEIYSLGATFYFILTKETPYHINVDFSYQKFSPSIPKYVVDCLAKTMAPRESDRYKSLDELITALGLSVSEIESIGQSQETNNSFYANPVLAVDSNKEGLTTVYNDLKQQNVLPYGTILEGNGYQYDIIKVLGQGAFGITYLANMSVRGNLGMLQSNIRVAIKEFFMKDLNGRYMTQVTSNSQGSICEKYKAKFLQEAQHLANLKHPNIVKVLESFSANNTYYYVMELIDGMSLNDYIKQKGGLTVEESIAVMNELGNALSYMHQHNMLHLDLKPQNVMRRNNGQIVLIDFGLSKHYDEYGNPETSTTLGGGTPGYAPLEQIQYRDGKSFPVTMDIYALAATFYKMLTAKSPQDASDVLNEGLDKESLKSRNVPSDIIDLIEMGMSPLKKNRPQTVDDFLAMINWQSATDRLPELDGLRGFVEAMVEEIILEDKSFDSYKQELEKRCENEGVDYRNLENDLEDFLENLNIGIKSSDCLAMAMAMAFVQRDAEKCYVRDEKIDEIITIWNKRNPNQKYYPHNYPNT